MDDRTNQVLLRHLALYPGMEAEDCIKLLYQGELGGGHLIEDEAEFAQRLTAELALPGLFAGAACEPQPVGGGLCRVPLSAFEGGPSAETLTRLCVLSAEKRGTEAVLREKLTVLRQRIAAGTFSIPAGQASVVDDYLASKVLRQPHHSQRYRELYHPHYRLTACDMAFYLPVFAAIDRALTQRPHVLVGIDGMSASGKSSLANLLKAVYGCGVVHADDFFLQPHQRTSQRLAEAGGNIDYERLAPVATKAGEGYDFVYRAYNCQTGAMGEEQPVPGGRLTVLEGAYCLHPKVAAPCDVRVFLGVDARVQMTRILTRSGPKLAQRFEREWIPMENRYNRAFGIRQSCDIVLDTSGLEEGG